MRTQLAVISLSLLCGWSSAQTRTVEDANRELNQAAMQALAVFEKSGVSGLESTVNGCWKGGVRPYCAYLDFSAKRITDFAHGALGTPQPDFFSIHEVVIRALSLVATTSLSLADQKAYLVGLERAANQNTDAELWRVAR